MLPGLAGLTGHTGLTGIAVCLLGSLGTLGSLGSLCSQGSLGSLCTCWARWAPWATWTHLPSSTLTHTQQPRSFISATERSATGHSTSAQTLPVPWATCAPCALAGLSGLTVHSLGSLGSLGSLRTCWAFCAPRARQVPQARRAPWTHCAHLPSSTQRPRSPWTFTSATGHSASAQTLSVGSLGSLALKHTDTHPAAPEFYFCN